MKLTTTKLVKCMKNWNMIVYSFWANLLLIFWFFSLIFHCLKASFVPCAREKLIIFDLTTTDFKHCWWFLLWCIFPHIFRWMAICLLIQFKIFIGFYSIQPDKIYGWHGTITMSTNLCCLTWCSFASLHLWSRLLSSIVFIESDWQLNEAITQTVSQTK